MLLLLLLWSCAPSKYCVVKKHSLVMPCKLSILTPLALWPIPTPASIVIYTVAHFVIVPLCAVAECHLCLVFPFNATPPPSFVSLHDVPDDSQPRVYAVTRIYASSRFEISRQKQPWVQPVAGTGYTPGSFPNGSPRHSSVVVAAVMVCVRWLKVPLR